MGGELKDLHPTNQTSRALCAPALLQALPSSAALGWIKVDARPIKHALATWTSKWVYLFTHHLQAKVGGRAGGRRRGLGSDVLLLASSPAHVWVWEVGPPLPHAAAW